MLQSHFLEVVQEKLEFRKQLKELKHCCPAIQR
jgi:hypothetical protein